MNTPGLVLAGGLSRRMGQDKALLVWRGQPLAARVAAALREAGCAPVWIVGTQPELDALGLPRIAEPEEGRLHPLFGVAAALDASRDSPLALICPCDLPLLTAAHVRRLLEAGRPCVARAGGQVHPLLAVLPTSSAARARELAHACAGARALTAGLDPVDLPESALLDANSAADLPGEGTVG